jgi:hypothetical protein
MVEGWRQEVQCCASTALTKASLGGMAPCGLGDGRDMMDLCRARALSDAVVVLMEGLVRVMQISSLKMTLR